MKENTASAASIPCGHNWDAYSKAQREQVVRTALQCGDVTTLVSLTDHNLMMFGRGGAHTSQHTRRNYSTGVRRYLNYALPLGWERLTQYDTDLTIGYIRMLEREGVSPGTINSRRSAARALYRALRWAGVLQADPFADTPRAKDASERWTKREAYSREDIEAMLEAATEDEHLLVLLGSHGGLRMSELVSLKWEQVDLERRVMTITGKGRKTALVYLSESLSMMLECVEAERRTGYVLPWRNPKSIRLCLRSLCKAAGVDYSKRQVHGLRHACATMLLEQTGDIYIVARHMRHSSVGTTEVYAKLNPKRLTAALSRW
ncbi:MAG: tyrosine-type recombinase/integrase [Deinococcus sp.]|uniref:tyrosine-type recombinase/integrase n=1 Tax=Deinococcus sp. TaxID=47478 RepID=UPI0026DBB727|nr:tyrosine-type recombinase/integrase [Deinococcus sp.]MDO4246782.1 tyrosine-type recombinase/integrase [Deinococcus sp.]